MSSVRVGINGFGRIGRIVFRQLAARPDEFDVAAINDLGSPKALAMLLKYDSVHGRFDGTIDFVEDKAKPENNALIVNGRHILITAKKDPRELPWKDLKVKVALESTGFFTNRSDGKNAGYDSHVAAGAERVILSAPAKDKPDITVVRGVNCGQIKSTDKYISNASCTTNCLAPMAKVLHEKFKIISGLMTTVHAYTNDQKVADQLHQDSHRSRAAALNIIPTSTGAAKAVGEVLPDLEGKLTGISLRVPVPVGSITDLVANVSRKVTKEEINAAIKEAADKPFADGGLKGILEYNTDPIVSSDIIGNSHSCIFDAPWTTVINDTMIKVLGWYDNEYGYSCRTADLIAQVGNMKAP